MCSVSQQNRSGRIFRYDSISCHSPRSFRELVVDLCPAYRFYFRCPSQIVRRRNSALHLWSDIVASPQAGSGYEKSGTMKYSAKRSKVIVLSVLWLLTIIIWAPVTTLGHIDNHHQGVSGTMVAQPDLASNSSGCPMHDCTGGNHHPGHCDLACQPTVNTTYNEMNLVVVTDSFSVSRTSAFVIISPVVLERPPKHLV